MEQRKQLVMAVLGKEQSVAELCREFGISRATAYEWVNRFREEGDAGLVDRSRKPRSVVKTDSETIVKLLELRHDHPRWGAKKLRAKLVRELRGEHIPCTKTIQRILDRVGEPRIRKPWKRIRPVIREKEALVAKAPNEVWTVDFKGWWRTADGNRCEPLTVRDAFSRKVLSIAILPSTAARGVRDEFVRLFKRYGLPEVIRVDNGAPFGCTSAPAGLSKVSAWWTSVGVRVSFSRPGHPEDNGGHERMHRDMAEELEARPAATLKAQQREAERWRRAFNEVRPHDALKGKTPEEVHRRSSREYNGVRGFAYPEGYERRRVKQHGELRVDGRTLFLSESLAGHEVAVRRTEAGRVLVRFYELELGVLEAKKAWARAEPFLKPVANVRIRKPRAARAA